MGGQEMEIRTTIFESGNAPVIFCDDVGQMVVKNDRIWYPLYVTKPSLAVPGQFENELVAWVTCPLRVTPSMIARAYHAIKPHRSEFKMPIWPIVATANHH